MSAQLELIAGGDPIRHQAAAWFARLRADDASEADRRQWRAWLAEDPRHRDSYARLEQLWSSLGSHAPTAEIAARLRAIPRAPKNARPRGHIVRRVFALAAVLAIAAIGALQWWPDGGTPAVQEHYMTGVGEHRRVLLPDGSRVTLDTDTRLRVGYSGRERRLELERGRAYFEVAREVRPFSVDTGHGLVRALGTAFEIYRRDDAVDVALLEGKVLLVADDDTRMQMSAGQMTRLAHSTRAMTVASLQDSAVPAWLTGRLVFEDAPLQDVASEFNRYSGRKIVLADPALQGIRVTGVFRSDRMQAFISALRDTYPVTADLSDPEAVRLARATDHAGR